MTTLKRFAANRLAMVGLAALVVVIVFVTVGPIVSPTEQVTTDLSQVYLRPGTNGHVLGTDSLGYDLLGRLMVAGRTSLLVGVLAGVLATLIGTLWGAIAGYVGGVVDSIMMRIVDAGIAIPAIFLLLVLSSIVEPSEAMMVLVIGLVSWLVPARLVRAESLSVKTRDYIVAAQAMGSAHSRIVLRHIVPNTVGTIVVNATFQVADAILLVAYVSFLGMGLQPPATDWGAMLNSGLSLIYQNAWWLILPPGIAIVVVVCALNFIGDGLRDAFDVRGKSA